MSGKYERKKQKSKKKSRAGLWILLIAVVLLGAAAVVYLGMGSGDADENPKPETAAPTESAATEPVTEETLPAETEPAEEIEYLFSIDDSIKITQLGSYSGKYMEDGSNEEVTDVMQITVVNIGTEPMQYAKIALEGDAGEALFEMTTLMPGDTMIVLETNRKTYVQGDVYTAVRKDNLAYFQYEPSVQADKLKVQPLDGGFNITNISGDEISGKITIYFKNIVDGVYYGGITYSGSIEGGMAEDEIRQIMSRNFTAENTQIVFINIT